MGSNNPLKAELDNIWKQVANSKGIQNYELHPDLNVLRGDGFLGEFYTGHVKNKDTGEITEIYVKKAINKKYANNLPTFENEVNFYSKIFPKLNAFQKEKGAKYPVNCVPKYFCGEYKHKKEYLAMENLKIGGYEMCDKTKLLDQQHLNYIFNNYGKFHALSFAFREQNQEQYYETINCLKDMFEIYGDQENLGLVPSIKCAIFLAYEALNNEGEVKTKVKTLLENINEVFNKAYKYDGKYNVITHGDCWSNNLMFKYAANGNITSIKLVDYQFCRDSTPIHDLSYFFYSGASEEDFNKLDNYLEIYHKSFSSFALELGCSPAKILSLDVLKSEWRKNSVLGILMGIMSWQIKLMDKKKISHLSGDSDDHIESEWIDHMRNLSESDIYKKRTTDILIHAVKYGIL